MRSVEPPADWPPSFDTTPCADDFASKAVEIQRAFVARMQQDMQVLPNHIDRLTQVSLTIYSHYVIVTSQPCLDTYTLCKCC